MTAALDSQRTAAGRGLLRMILRLTARGNTHTQENFRGDSVPKLLWSIQGRDLREGMFHFSENEAGEFMLLTETGLKGEDLHRYPSAKGAGRAMSFASRKKGG